MNPVLAWKWFWLKSQCPECFINWEMAVIAPKKWGWCWMKRDGEFHIDLLALSTGRGNECPNS